MSFFQSCFCFAAPAYRQAGMVAFVFQSFVVDAPYSLFRFCCPRVIPKAFGTGVIQIEPLQGYDFYFIFYHYFYIKIAVENHVTHSCIHAL